jgi:chromosome segregation ATPase
MSEKVSAGEGLLVSDRKSEVVTINPLIETRVAILENNFSQMSTLFDKLDTAIEKLTDLSSSIKELLAVHEHKIDVQKDLTLQLANAIEQRRVEADNQYDELEEQIKESNKKIIMSLHKEKEEVEKELVRYNEAFRNNNKELLDVKVKLDRYKVFFYIVFMFFGFVLWKLKVIPAIPFLFE